MTDWRKNYLLDKKAHLEKSIDEFYAEAKKDADANNWGPVDAAFWCIGQREKEIAKIEEELRVG